MPEFFDRFSTDDAEAIRRLGSPLDVAAGETLFERGDEARRFFWIERGAMHVVLASPSGKQLVLRRLGPGDVLGELAIFTSARRSASVVAAEPARLFVVDSRELRALLPRRPSIAVALLQILSERTQALTHQLEDSYFLPMRGRLAKLLLDLAADGGQETEHGVLLGERLSQTLLGRLVYASREEVNRELARWSRDGWVRRSDGRIEITDLDALESLIGESPADGEP